MRVLVIDDSSTMRTFITRRLEILGVKDIIEASDGNDGYNKILDNQPIQLVLLDINMPGMDGIQLLKNLRENKHLQGLKVLMCSSDSDKSRVVEAIKLGAAGYLLKPFSPETFAEKIKPFLPK